jgi:hypothetical protein
MWSRHRPIGAATLDGRMGWLLQRMSRMATLVWNRDRLLSQVEGTLIPAHINRPRNRVARVTHASNSSPSEPNQKQCMLNCLLHPHLNYLNY